MSLVDLSWGLIVVGAGIFIAVYGNPLFKFALAAMGFGAGFVICWGLLDSQPDGTRVLISLAVGGVAAALFFMLVRFGTYIAGAILGALVGVLIGGLINIIGPTPGDFLTAVLVVGGIGGGGFLAPRLGNLVIVLATSAAGSFLIIEGIQIWYASRIGGELDDPTQTLAQKLTVTLFMILFAVSFLGQSNAVKLRRRVVN